MHYILIWSFLFLNHVVTSGQAEFTNKIRCIEAACLFKNSLIDNKYYNISIVCVEK